uniref:Uncharacterized protein n=1 Tax=Kalanchoe fedtschenkoi TaxID=63787 RepID=A0A7N0UZE1_KALFE
MARGIFSCFGRPSFFPRTTTASSSSSATADESSEEARRCGPVVVELFSSQGCATSPVAELVVSRLARGDFDLEMPVVVLAYHVDYWDYAGWKDPFGSSLWTVRQKAYVEALRLDTMFTPQVVVQGRSHCLGNDEEALLATINAAPRFPALAFQATFAMTEPQTLQVSLTGSMRSKAGTDEANVMVALYESGAVTDCPGGENKGKVLSNDFVVRKLEKLCSVEDIMIGKKSVNEVVNFSLWEGFNRCKCGAAVFVQNSQHHVFGSQSFKLPDNLS